MSAWTRAASAGSPGMALGDVREARHAVPAAQRAAPVDEVQLLHRIHPPPSVGEWRGDVRHRRVLAGVTVRLLAGGDLRVTGWPGCGELVVALRHC
ncbi:MAG: hypothetical protein ACRDQZ_21410 [Mycobacteriales bacterium]